MHSLPWTTTFTIAALTLASLGSVSAQDRSGQSPIDASLTPNVALEALVRSWPWESFEGKRSIQLRLRDPSKPPKDLVAAAGAPTGPGDTKETTSATIVVKVGAAQADILQADVSIQDLKRAGTYTFPIRFWERDYPVEGVTVAFTARDAPWAPTLAIVLGVLASFSMRHLVERYEPRQRFLAKLEDRRRELDDLTRADEDQKRYASRVGDQLDILEYRSETDDLSELARSLEDIVTELGKELLSVDERDRMLRKELNRSKILFVKERDTVLPKVTPSEAVQLQGFENSINGAAKLLSQGRLRDAEMQYEASKVVLSAMRRERQHRLIKIINDLAGRSALKDPAEFETLRTRAREALDTGDPDKAAAPLDALLNVVTLSCTELPEDLQREAGEAQYGTDGKSDLTGQRIDRRSTAKVARGKALRARRLVTGISIVLATVSGLAALYFGKPFGGAVDYLVAGVWGFGSDGAVQNVNALLKRFQTTAA